MVSYVFHSKENDFAYDKKSIGVRVTVVGEIDGSTMRFSVSRCGSEDRFERKKGLEIASKRLADNVIFATTSIANVPSQKMTKLFINASKAISSAVASYGINAKIELLRADLVYHGLYVSYDPIDVFEQLSNKESYEFAYIKR